jgi:hypothetical protein
LPDMLKFPRSGIPTVWSDYHFPLHSSHASNFGQMVSCDKALLLTAPVCKSWSSALSQDYFCKGGQVHNVRHTLPSYFFLSIYSLAFIIGLFCKSSFGQNFCAAWYGTPMYKTLRASVYFQVVLEQQVSYFFVISTPCSIWGFLEFGW